MSEARLTDVHFARIALRMKDTIFARACGATSRGVSTQTEVFYGGNSIPFPGAVAPAAMQKMAHPDGEEATARACGAYGIVMGLSAYSITGLGQVKRAVDATRRAIGLKGIAGLVL
ncbi:hypothetical protein AAE478_005118 [Parahypoxylon ruwenzoriense]